MLGRLRNISEGIMNINVENMVEKLTRVGDLSERYIGLQSVMEDLVLHFLAALYPAHFGRPDEWMSMEEKQRWELLRTYEKLTKALGYVCSEREEAVSIADRVMEKLPEISRVLSTDIQAAYEGDPAATGLDEVILTYPAFKAISIYRLAHELYVEHVKILPRMMTEYAHRSTGIDIHPGATIGEYFFIDHGTGVVIGETTTIGNHVKLYQHVTLGALSFAVGEDGSLVKGIKRHPDVGNNVVIYAGATILGGNTRIGDDAVVGGNVWLTHSLEAGAQIRQDGSVRSAASSAAL